ncbi:TerB family tellurite resistance protein [Parvularcula lutaonensis]|uniref:TerB family tellurite resistance protein n=1 Tax=Parvularcula lutaonensis TaxID=491923 RepID=A0ABV7MF64_9PROT|nr:TerB family tellurite resistance protein [Parvularcula lutaonensis]GGY52221.1 hypothetical protein GCM10007148_21640 [Parvularcula lutaonensis]
MVLKNFTEWLAPGDGETKDPSPKLPPRVGAAGLLIAAAHREGRFTDVEKDLVAAALMKLFMLTNPDARALREEAEKELFENGRSFVDFAAAAKELDRDEQEALVTHIWRIVDLEEKVDGEHPFVSSVRDYLGFTKEQAEALRPAED